MQFFFFKPKKKKGDLPLIGLHNSSPLCIHYHPSCDQFDHSTHCHSEWEVGAISAGATIATAHFASASVREAPWARERLSRKSELMSLCQVSMLDHETDGGGGGLVGWLGNEKAGRPAVL